MNDCKLVLETKEVFYGKSFGAKVNRVADLAFNTAVVGYQETLSDPSNCSQILCMAYPVIGNYGLTDEDYESSTITVSGVIVKKYNPYPSNFRYTHELAELMEESGVPGIEGVDTREIVRILKSKGTMKAMICDISVSDEDALKAINEYSTPTNLVEVISTKKVWHSRTVSYKYTVACIDCGLKRSLVKMLNDLSCNVVVLPYNASLDTIMKYKPDGVFISDGPGSPFDVKNVVETINQIKGKLPIVGVGLGQELIGLAYGAKLFKQHVGHNGVNLPVRNLKTNKIEITNQNDLYALEPKSLKKTGLTLTHVNLLDDVAEGVEDLENKVIAVQYNPQADYENPEFVFNRFIDMMSSKKKGGKR